MGSRILKEMYETAKAQYELGTLPIETYMNIKRLYEAEQRGNKVSKKSKQFLTETASGDTIVAYVQEIRTNDKQN